LYGAWLWSLLGVGVRAELPLIVAHRGASDEAPENTLAAFRLAWERGADAIEGDFRLTRDGHIVAMHDETTERTAGGIDWRVADSPLSQLQTLDVGAWKGEQFRGQRVPTLPQVLAIVPPGKKIFIEVKCGPELVLPLRDALRAAALTHDQLVVISFHESVIEETRRQLPDVKAMWLTGYKQDEDTGKWIPSSRDVLQTLTRIGAAGLDTQGNRHVVDAAFVAELRARQLEFHVWTIDEPAEAEYFRRLGADSITTNRPATLRAELQR
jgi:glycerophosphoryl diester phosphodiesterase